MRSPMTNVVFRYTLVLLYVLGLGSCATNTTHYNNVSEFNCTRDKSGTIIPGTPSIRLTTTYCNDYIFKHDSMRKAIALFASEYAEAFGMEELEVWELLRGLTIELSVIPKTVRNVYDIDGNFFKKDVPITGLAISKDIIWVEIRTPQIWSSSLAHELVHIIIWRTQGVHADPDHEGTQFSGWTQKHTQFLKRFENMLMDLEI